MMPTTPQAIRAGWLADQLPGVLGEDPFVRQFLRIFEDVAATVRESIDALPAYMDVGVTPSRFVPWLGMWVGIDVPPGLSEYRQREIVVAAGSAWTDRGTARGLRRLVEAATGGPVEVSDGGGVFGRDEAPRGQRLVVVEVSQLGELSELQLLRLVEEAVPAQAAWEVRLGDRTLRNSEREAR